MSIQGRLIVEGGLLAVGDGRVLDGATLVIDGERVAEVREDGTLPAPMPGDSHLDADGRLVTGGLVDAWSVLPPGRERAAAHLAESVLSGATSVVAVAPASLSEEMIGFTERLGLRTLLGLDCAGGQAQIAIEAWRRLSERLRGRRTTLIPALSLGRVALWSQEEFTERIGGISSLRGRPPLLITAAEREEDLQEVYDRFGCRPVERLRRLGALGPTTIVGHGNLLDVDEIDTLARTGAWLAACPRSAWRHGLVPPIERVRDRGGNVALGTAEAGPGPMSEVTTLATVGRAGPKHGLATGTEALMGGASLMSAVLDAPTGVLASGAVADVVVHRCRPSAPVDGSTWSRALAGAPGADWVIVGGRIILREGKLLGVDLAALARSARRR